MTSLRRGFYLLLGLTFPFFWAVHAAGFLAALYRPLQHLFATAGTGWPSMVTAALLDKEVEVILLATNQGLVVCQRSESGGWQILHRALESISVTSVTAREGVILAGTTDGVYRSDDRGRTWREASGGLSARHVRWMAYHPEQPDFELAGTEPAGIFISRDGGESWRECPEVAEMRRRFRWYLPYSPEAGCVRGFAYQEPVLCWRGSGWRARLSRWWRNMDSGTGQSR